MKPPQEALDLAIVSAALSPCGKSRRGVVVFDTNQRNLILAQGCNYLPIGRCNGSDICQATCAARCRHAEENATVDALVGIGTGGDVSGLEVVHIETIEGVPQSSGAPSCYHCSGFMLASGIAAVWLLHEHGWHQYEIEEFHRLSLEMHGMQP